MIKNDTWIAQQAQLGMIFPFSPTLIRNVFGYPAISFGLSSFGYDIRLSNQDFRIFKHIPGSVVDPKNFNPDNLESADLHSDQFGRYFILPAHSYGLGVAMEHLSIPDNISVLCIGKSTYARCGIIANLTPAEAGWNGYLTLEFSNSSNADCKIYANEGIVQLLFLEGQPCDVTYDDRNGKYQGQLKEVTLARI